MRRSGRTIRLVFAASALASVLLGCRAILGIEDFEPAERSDASTGEDAFIGDAPPDDDAPRLSDGGIVPCLDSGDPQYFSAAKQVVVGEGFACALATDLQVYCWGDNSKQQLGATTTSKVGQGEARPVHVGIADDVAEIAAGDAHACALTTAGHVFCWGDNSAGQAGITGALALPVDVSSGRLYSSIAASGDHTCAVESRPGAAVWCWGAGKSDQLGVATDGGSTFVSVRGFGGAGTLAAPAATLAGGQEHECVLFADASVACWGADSKGQLANGVGPMDASLAGLAFAGIGPVSGIRAGGRSSCALTLGGIWCAGENDSTELGSGVVTGAAPAEVDYGAGVAPVDIALTNFRACAWNDGGRLFCFGGADAGGLGTGGAGSGAVVGVDGGTSFGPVLGVAMWSSSNASFAIQTQGSQGPSTCAIVDDGCNTAGTVYCWGADADGQLGNGAIDAAASTDRPVPVLRGDLPR